MSAKNAEQIAEWDGALGRRWVEQQRAIEPIVFPFGQAALEAAAPKPGERVIDVGCGCGDTSVALARRVGETGAVLGVDVSKPMLEVARSRGAPADFPNLSFRQADASAARLPKKIDLLFSRFGVMFFDEPTAAFAHLRKSLRAAGRCVFACWRTPRDNPWMMTPLVAARQATGITPVRGDPHAPGPFAFADDDRLRAILLEAGFARVDMHRFDAPIFLGATVQSAAGFALRMGATARFVREFGTGQEAAIGAAIEATFAPLAAPDGQVHLNGSAWIVSAVQGAAARVSRRTAG